MPRRKRVPQPFNLHYVIEHLFGLTGGEDLNGQYAIAYSRNFETPRPISRKGIAKEHQCIDLQKRTRPYRDWIPEANLVIDLVADDHFKEGFILSFKREEHMDWFDIPRPLYGMGDCGTRIYVRVPESHHFLSYNTFDWGFGSSRYEGRGTLQEAFDYFATIAGEEIRGDYTNTIAPPPYLGPLVMALMPFVDLEPLKKERKARRKAQAQALPKAA